MLNVIITQQGDVRNKGEHAILKSEISFLEEIYRDIKVTVLTLYPERLKRVEPKLEVYSPLIDLQIRGKYRPPLMMYPSLLFLQVFLSFVSILLRKTHLKPIYRAAVIEKFERADLVISSGTEAFMEGSLFQGRQTLISRATSLFMLFWGMYEVFIVKKVFRKPFLTFPQSIGPLRTWMGRFAIRFILNNVDAVLLREAYSLTLLKDIKKKAPIYVIADMAFLFKNSLEFGQQLPRPVIGVSPCFPHGFSDQQQRNYISVHSKVLDYLVEKHNVNVVFLPSVIGYGETERRERMGDDLEVCRKILQNMTRKEKAKIICAGTADEFEHLVRQLDLLIATRMHPCILASIKNIPFISVIYEHKQVGMLEKLGLMGVNVNINAFSYAEFKSKVEYAWSQREVVKKQLSLKIPLLQKQMKTDLGEIFLNITRSPK